jgi:hypothetical protein
MRRLKGTAGGLRTPGVACDKAERCIPKPRLVGSNPTGGAKSGLIRWHSDNYANGVCRLRGARLRQIACSTPSMWITSRCSRHGGQRSESSKRSAPRTHDPPGFRSLGGGDGAGSARWCSTTPDPNPAPPTITEATEVTATATSQAAVEQGPAACKLFCHPATFGVDTFPSIDARFEPVPWANRWFGNASLWTRLPGSGVLPAFRDKDGLRARFPGGGCSRVMSPKPPSSREPTAASTPASAIGLRERRVHPVRVHILGRGLLGSQCVDRGPSTHCLGRVDPGVGLNLTARYIQRPIPVVPSSPARGRRSLLPHQVGSMNPGSGRSRLVRCPLASSSPATVAAATVSWRRWWS